VPLFVVSGHSGTGKTLMLKALEKALEGLVPVFMIHPSALFLNDPVGDSESASFTTVRRAGRERTALLVIDGVNSSDLRTDTFRFALEEFFMDSGYGNPVVLTLDDSSDVPEWVSDICRKEFVVPPPSKQGRENIINGLCKKLGLDASSDMVFSLAGRTGGYLYSDLELLMNQALTIIRNEEGLSLHSAIEISFARSRPSILAGCPWWRPLSNAGLGASPRIQVDSVDHALSAFDQRGRRLFGVDVALMDILANLRAAFGGHFQDMNLTPSRGVLLHGPTGTGKTALASAAAASCGANAVVVDAADVVSSVIGESERAVKQLFAFARTVAPCVIVIDHLEVLAPRRSTEMAEGPGTYHRILSTLLVELDGSTEDSQRRQSSPFLVIAMTDSIERVDPAVLRSGRIEVHVKMKYPDDIARERMIRDRLMSCSLEGSAEMDANVGLLMKASCDMSPAEIEALCEEVKMVTFREQLTEAKIEKLTVSRDHIVSVVGS